MRVADYGRLPRGPGAKECLRPGGGWIPIAEVEEDGSLVITKPVGSGGVVNTRTVKEQILYELDDPGNYLTPDVTLDITDVEVEQIGPDRVRVSGARGKPAPDTWKVTISVDGGWLGEGEISYAGPECARPCEVSGADDARAD